ncbi:MAG: phage tail protein [bacterium]
MPRRDPYKGFKFRIKWNGKYVAAVQRVSALRRTTEVIEFREGGDPSSTRKLPGLTRYHPITLEAGIICDPAFEDWANLVSDFAQRGATTLRTFRKDLAIDLYDEQDRLVKRYFVHRAWISEYVAVSDLDSNVSEIALTKITIEHEGWERDRTVAPPED